MTAGDDGMTDPRDRILEAALERMFDEELPADGVERILSAWKRGVTGTGLEALDLDPPERAASEAGHGGRVNGSGGSARVAHPVAPARARRATTPWLRAAAALLLVAGGLTLWRVSIRSAPSGPHLLADRRVALQADPGGSADARPTRPTRIVVPDRRVVVEDQPVTLTWPAEGTGDSTPAGRRQLVAAAGTVFEWRPADAQAGASERLVVHRGALELVPGAAPALATGSARPGAPRAGSLDLRLADAQLRVEPGCSMAARLDDAGPEAGAARVRVAVRAGAAVLAYATLEQRLAAGEERDLPRDAQEWWRTSGEPVAELCAQLPWKEMPARSFNPDSWLERSLRFDEIARGLALALERDPFAWEVVARQFGELREASEPAYERRIPRGELDFLAWDLSPRALEVARGLWVRSPESFSEEHLVAFASLGSFEFERELRALVESDSPELDSGVLAAAFYARQGDDVGRARLERAARGRAWDSAYRSMGGWTEALLAAAALDWLGDRGPWEALLPYLREEVQRSLDAGFPTFAAYMLAFADHFLVEGRDVLRRLPMDPSLALRYAAMEERASTPGKIRDLLDDVADRW